MSANTIATLVSLNAALETARLACIAAQNKRDLSAVAQTNKNWNKIERAFKKVELIAHKEDKEEYYFQMALMETFNKIQREKEESVRLGNALAEMQARELKAEGYEECEM